MKVPASLLSKLSTLTLGGALLVSTGTSTFKPSDTDIQADATVNNAPMEPQEPKNPDPCPACGRG